MGNSIPKESTAADIVEGKDLSGKTILVTGAYSGLGASSTEAFLSVGATVIVAGRSEKLQSAFVEELVKVRKFDASKIDGSKLLDLGDLDSVKEFANYIKGKYETIDVLLLNAGVMATPPGKTKNGFEIQMGVNGIGHFLLAKILAKQTKRQVWVSSKGHSLIGNELKFDNENAPRIRIDDIETVDDKYEEWARYQQSKLANVLLAKQFAKEYPEMEACSIHPGMVATNLGRHMDWKLMMMYTIMMKLGVVKAKTPDQGASTQVLCCVADTIEQGGYYADDKIEPEAECAKNEEDAKALYDYCDKVTKAFQ